MIFLVEKFDFEKRGKLKKKKIKKKKKGKRKEKIRKKKKYGRGIKKNTNPQA